MNKPTTKKWVLLIAFLILGVFIGQYITRPQRTISIDGQGKWSKLALIFQQIEENYMDSVNAEELVENTLPFLTEILDPHSLYIPAADMADANEAIEGNFDGIGIVFNMTNDTVVVMNVVNGGPSERAGIHPGDRIITVNDSVIAGRKVEQNAVVKMLRGKRGSRVTIGIERYGEEALVQVVIVRDKIPVKSVDAAYMMNATTGFIKISKFSKTTHKEFIAAIELLQKNGMKNLILDLRGNSGGLLEQAFQVANEFLDNGNMIVYTEGRARPRYEYRATNHGSCRHINLAILIDKGSASASEIVAGAIQDNDRGTIVGQRSFGKGLVQEPIMFSDHSGLRLSVARYYTPTGRSIQKPYRKNNYRDYENELYERFLHGEMYSSDSSKFTGQRYYTPKGKVVYGGGGIMPDLFVPEDTSSINDFARTLSRRNLIYRFVLQFTDRHRNELNNIKTLDDLNDYFSNYDLGVLFRNYAAAGKVIATDAQWEETKETIIAFLRAYIGHNTPLEDNALYAMTAGIDDTAQAALNLFN
ncbi:MAG: S41 family peptidase [Prevotellaceae bacterium]|jgi:carboxyl-terminal processing protease|nr:S41 family peptidase [Prevotellaceae bacterium]